jgi:hypothetical protein
MSTNVTENMLWKNSPLYAETCSPNHSDAEKRENNIFLLHFFFISAANKNHFIGDLLLSVGAKKNLPAKNTLRNMFLFNPRCNGLNF